jgi:glycosyltransferase involved in cell wall biosynthesis
MSANKNILFSIITPTYNRPALLQQAIQSVTQQNYMLWEMIIVNDSPDADYTQVEHNILTHKLKHKIHYYKNKKNEGVNFSRNFALDHVTAKSDYIIFLDDDDQLSEKALKNLADFIQSNKGMLGWLITNKRDSNGKNFTKITKSKSSYSYFFDYLLKQSIQGDATHIINTSIAKKYFFSKKILNGEEWFYFIQLPCKLKYADLNTTIIGQYSITGLNSYMKKTYFKNTYSLFLEINSFKMFVYLVIRFTIQIVRRLATTGLEK